jgi:hypothetical protein
LLNLTVVLFYYLLYRDFISAKILKQEMGIEAEIELSNAKFKIASTVPAFLDLKNSVQRMSVVVSNALSRAASISVTDESPKVSNHSHISRIGSEDLSSNNNVDHRSKGIRDILFKLQEETKDYS